MRKLYEGFVKSFVERYSLLFRFVLCCTQQNAMLGNLNFQKIWGAGPQALVTLRQCLVGLQYCTTNYFMIALI